MNAELPGSIDDALPRPVPQATNPLATLLILACFWGVTAYALRSVIWPKADAVTVSERAQLKGLTAANAVELTNEVVTALAVDQFSSMLLKVQLAQQVVQRLQTPPPQPPASPAVAR